MDSRQESKLNMYHAVIAHCDANTVIVATVPAFATILTAFKAKVSSIESTAQQEAQVISGVATDKKVMRATLCQQAADIGAVVYSYAVSQGDNTLKESVDFSKSDLKNLRDDQLAPTCNNIHDAANANLVALATYGITAPMLTSFQTLIDDYSALVPSPRNAASLRKTYAANLKTFIKDADDMLNDQMDPLAVQYKAANINFYNTYKNNRIIIDAAVSYTQAAGTITISGTDNPIYGVQVAVIGFPFAATSNADGTYSLKIPVNGTYSISFSKSGYQTREAVNVEITLGQTTPLNIELAPA